MFRLRFLAWALVGLNTIDAVSTLIAVQTGIASEMNPLMQGLLELHPASFLAFKFFLGVLILALLYLQAIQNIQPITVALASVVVMYSITLVQHVRIWVEAYIARHAC